MMFDPSKVTQHSPELAAPGSRLVRPRFASWVATVVGVVAIGSVAGCNSNKESVAQAPPAPHQSPIDVAPSAEQAASAPATARPAVAATPSTRSKADYSTVSFAMPNLVGMNLQDAQDKVQTYGVFYSKSHDLHGSRMQILDSNWKVCDQNIKPGTRIEGPAKDYEGKIDFGTVKIAEDCP